MDGLVGKKAPDIALKDINGKNVSVSSLKGKAVLINFWATWCLPCRTEMPALNKLYKEYRDSGLVVLAVSIDGSSAAVREYIEKYPVDFPILLDPDKNASRQFRVFSLPTSFLLDKKGFIIQRYLGEENWDSPEIKLKIKNALEISQGNK